jgi:hypothetical protein
MEVLAMTKTRLISKIDNFLVNHAFTGGGPLWKKVYTDFVDIIDLQVSKSGDLFTINLGIADKFVVRTCWGIGDLDLIDEPACTVRSRLGELLYGRDVWWSLADNGGIEEVLRGIEDVAIPFFRLNRNIDSLIKILEDDPAACRYPPGVIYLALLNYRKGDRELCSKIFSSMKLTGAWSKKASEILDALT